MSKRIFLAAMVLGSWASAGSATTLNFEITELLGSTEAFAALGITDQDTIVGQVTLDTPPEAGSPEPGRTIATYTPVVGFLSIGGSDYAFRTDPPDPSGLRSSLVQFQDDDSTSPPSAGLSADVIDIIARDIPLSGSSGGLGLDFLLKSFGANDTFNTTLPSIDQLNALSDDGAFLTLSQPNSIDRLTVFSRTITFFEPATEPDPDLAPVPLPAGAWLLVAGLGGLACVGRKRRAKTE